MVSPLFKFLLLIMLTPMLAKKVKYGPHWNHQERTSCEEFGKYARFNPNSMHNQTWFVFYYWAPPPSTHYFYFTVPSKQNYTVLHKVLDERTDVPVNWTAKHLLLTIGPEISLLVEQGDRGEYLMYNVRLAAGLPVERKLTPLEVRLKQTGDNKLVGMMICQKEMTFALVRRKDLPKKNKLAEEAARLNYRSRGGKSYLYQGHHWMPVPEMDERLYWSGPIERFMYDPSGW